MKPSCTRWLTHERCVKAVKASYSSIVLPRKNIYETSHEPEALGLNKAPSSHSTIAAMYLHYYILPQVSFTATRCKRKVKTATCIEVTHLDICSFQERVGKPFIRLIKDNLSSQFRSSLKDVLSSFSIFDPKKMPSLSTHELLL